MSSAGLHERPDSRPGRVRRHGPGAQSGPRLLEGVVAASGSETEDDDSMDSPPDLLCWLRQEKAEGQPAEGISSDSPRLVV